jgi:Concanavalin A-like lectin/glucanases superfamily
MEQEPLTRRELLLVTGAAGLATLGATIPLGAAPAPSYKNAVLAKKPVGYWRLGEAMGPNALDSSGHGHNGTYHGTPTFRQRGAIKGDPNTAIKLDGRHSYVEIPDHKDFSQPTSGKGLTVEVWVRPDILTFAGETDDPYIHWLGKGEPNQHEWALRFYSRKSRDRPNRISAYIFNPAGGLGAGAYYQPTTRDPLREHEWIHLVACFDPGDADTPGKPGVQIYKNGVRLQGPSDSGTLYKNPHWHIKPAHGTAPLRLGTRDLGSYLTGGLDEVAIYPRALTTQEIVENYTIGKGR